MANRILILFYYTDDIILLRKLFNEFYEKSDQNGVITYYETLGKTSIENCFIQFIGFNHLFEIIFSISATQKTSLHFKYLSIIWFMNGYSVII